MLANILPFPHAMPPIQINTVLSPTHFLSDPQFSSWFSVDRAACLALRAALDREGGSHIAIDYPVIHSRVALHPGAVRSELLSGTEKKK